MAHIGPVRVVTSAQLFKPRVFTYASPWRCPMTFTINEETGQKVWKKLPHVAGKCGHVISHLVSHDRRNHLIAQILQTAYSRGRKIILMSERTKHLRLLRGLIIQYGVRPVDIRYYWGGLSDEEIDVAKAKPVLLATYAYASEATDIPWLDCVILATPRAGVKQAIGRVLREHPMKPTPIVFDITDNDSPVFRGYLLKRSALYRSMGAIIEV